MTNPAPRLSAADWIALAIVFLVAGGVRVAYVVTLADGGKTVGPILVQDDSPVLRDLSRDGTEQDWLIKNMTEHRWFGCLAPFAAKEEQTAHTSPGYPWLVGLTQRLFSLDDVGPLMSWVQCVLGALTAVLYFLISMRAFHSRAVAILAGVLCALNPFWVVNTAAVNDGTMTSFMTALVIYLGTHAVQTGAPYTSLFFGLGLAGLSLLRAPLLPFAFVALLWLLWHTRRLDRGWLCALLAFLGFINGLGPWMLRNFLAFREPIPIVDSAYLHLWMGVNSRANGGPQSEEEMLLALAERRSTSVDELRERLSKLPQPARYRELTNDVLIEIGRDPGAFINHRLEAGLCFLVGESWLADRQFAVMTWIDDRPAGPKWLVNAYNIALPASLFLMLFLAWLGWRWTFAWRQHGGLLALAVICIPIPYILSHAERLSGPRMPLDGVFLTYAAFALCCAWPGAAVRLMQGPKEAS